MPDPSARPSFDPSADPLSDTPPSRSTRATPRRATSAVAYCHPEPEADDPLLGFVPYLHAAPRRNSITPERQRAFVAELAATGIVAQAARKIGKSLEALYTLRSRPGAEGFAQAWDAALDRGVQRLEDCALERALTGTATPIVGGGQILGWWDRPDNHLLRFLLQHRLPQRYGAARLQPGHPVYDGIARAVLAAERARIAANEETVLVSLVERLGAMQAREEAAAALLAGRGQGAGADRDRAGDGEPVAGAAPLPSITDAPITDAPAGDAPARSPESLRPRIGLA